MVRLKDIAARAGVDVSTVSRALGGDPEISRITQEQIKKLAAEMGYIRKIRRVRTGRIPGLVGVIIPEVLSGYYSVMLDRLNANLRVRGKTPLLGITDFKPELAEQYIAGFAKSGAAGLIYIMDACEAPLHNKTEKILFSCNIPTVFITGSLQNTLEFDSVYVDEMSGARKAVSHLVELGHQIIGFIGENHTTGRADACRAVLRENNLNLLPAHCRIGSERLERGGYLRMKELLAAPCRPTAVFVAYDQMAIGASLALQEAGCSVPGELSIVSFDNINASEFVFGGLTTVATPMDDTVSVAVRLLLDRIDGQEGRAVQHVTIQPSLVVRHSTAAIEPARPAAH
jgi:LacI family transcriptional regulator